MEHNVNGPICYQNALNFTLEMCEKHKPETQVSERHKPGFRVWQSEGFPRARGFPKPGFQSLLEITDNNTIPCFSLVRNVFFKLNFYLVLYIASCLSIANVLVVFVHYCLSFCLLQLLLAVIQKQH